MREPRFNRVVILAEGAFELEGAKTAVGIIRYGQCKTVAVIDSRYAGKSVGDLINVGHDIPIVASLQDALKYDPEAFVIGIAPKGGILPEAWKATVLDAIRADLDIVSGLHSFLADDPEISTLASERGVVVADVRRPPAFMKVSEGRCRDLSQEVVLTIGTDCCVGKMTVSLEINNLARQRGLSTDFVATGQTGIMIWGRGISVDACISDFLAGAVESMVLDAAERADIILVEGQGSLYHPGYSAVTLGLIHGAMPRQMILCHNMSRTEVGSYGIKIPPFNDVVEYHHSVCKPLFPTHVTGIALNTFYLSEEEARKVIDQAEDQTGLPVTDCIRFGSEKLLDAIIQNRKIL